MPSPRLRAAMRLYSSGAVRTKGEAADAVGLNRQYLYLMSSPGIGNTHLRQITEEVDAALQDRTVDMSSVLSLLGRRAVGVIHEMMEYSESDMLRFKAAQDLADRSPETSKTIKAAVANVHLTGADAKELAAALVSSARVKEQYAHVAEGDFVRVDLGEAVQASPNEQSPNGDEWTNKISLILQKK